MKDKNEVIKEFNEFVNMTASELENWLKSDDSNSAGWPQEDQNGETVGHDSGRKIVAILKENPKKDPEKYMEDHISHMRKVVSYCKRHLAQETKSNEEKPKEEVKKTKSYASLKNWGHDFLKARDQNGRTDDGEKDEEKEKTGDNEKTGEKRKTKAGQSGSSKKQETKKGESEKKGKGSDEDEEYGEGEEEQEETANGKESNDHKVGSKNDSKEEDEDDVRGDSKTEKGPKKGQTVTWNWGGGQPEGKVLDVKGEKTTITTKNGNEVSRKGVPDDPAVVLDTGKSKAIKSNHELNETS